MLGATLLLVGVGYLWFGSDVINIYATQILPRSLQGEVLDPYSVHAASGAALFHRLLIAEPALNPVPLLNSPSLYAVLYPLWQLAILVPLLAVFSIRANRADTEPTGMGRLRACPSCFVACAVQLSLRGDDLLHRSARGCPSGAQRVWRCGPRRRAILPHFSHRVPAHSRVRALRLVLFWDSRACGSHCCCGQCSSSACGRTERKLLKADSLRAVSLCAVVAVAWTVGAFGYHRHFAYLNQEMSRRIPASVNPYLASGPRPTSGGYVFTAMLPDGYRVLDQAGSEVWKGDKGRRPMDQLSVAVAQNSPVLLLELADSTGSRIVAIPSGAPSRTIRRILGH